MSDSSFWSAYKDPRWQKVRLRIMERDDWQCVHCGCRDKSLHVHHSHYVRGAMPWEYEDESLLTLCETCHEEVSTRTRSLAAIAGRLSTNALDQLIGVALYFSVTSREEYDALKPENRMQRIGIEMASLRCPHCSSYSRRTP